MRSQQKQACLQQLKRTFGLEGFRPGQEAAVNTLLSGRDLMCILPTGAGKSLCWQLPAVMHEGLTVVVSPLIALMRDQIRALQERGVSAETLDSLMTPQERHAAGEKIASGVSRIVFVSPERLLTDGFIRICRKRPPWLLVVDEAHCVVQWGSGFRPEYQQIDRFIRDLPVRPVLCALTATADRRMQRELISHLGMYRVRRITMTIIRENLQYEVVTTLRRNQEILRRASDCGGKAVVFCRSRIRTERLCRFLQEQGMSAEYYHAGMDRDERNRVQSDFQGGRFTVLAATTAFGMGVDIPDIRLVIHDDPPDSVTDYLQQSGRAGRDGKAAVCVLLMSPSTFLSSAKRYRSELQRLKRHPIRRMLHLRRSWKSERALLRCAMASRCFVSAMAGQMGQRVPPCGQCSACRRGKLVERVPDLPQMDMTDAAQWLLAWQRSAIARRDKTAAKSIATDKELRLAAQFLSSVPVNARFRKDFDGLINSMRRSLLLKEEGETVQDGHK